MQDVGYTEHILQLYDDAIEALHAKGIERDFIDYRIKYQSPKYKTPKAPTSAFSDFLINRQFGDWTETLLRASFNLKFPNFKAIKYGVGSNLIAGENGFKEMYNGYHAEIRAIGKRPDLLIFGKETVDSLNISDDVSEMQSTSLMALAKRATYGFEVRSSKYLAGQYRAFKSEEQSFTPKLEDIPILTHWIAEHGIPCFYVQVFFDEAHIISFEKILRIIIKSGDKYLDQQQRNQMKQTFYLPTTLGTKIGQIIAQPTWKVDTKIMRDGRLIIYATPENGTLQLVDNLIEIINHEPPAKTDGPNLERFFR